MSEFYDCYLHSIDVESVPYFAGVHGPSSHMSSLSPGGSVEGAAIKYGQAPGGDSLTDFVTLVCQETSNSHHQVGGRPSLILQSFQCEQQFLVATLVNSL